jgi:MFS transporter, DHA2 family, multidrug resistance protein
MPRDSDGLPPGERRWAVAVLVVGTLMAVLDGSIANVALPTIARELRVDPSASIWVVNSYQLALTATLVPFASFGQIAGYRGVYAWGIGIFTLGSLACARSSSLGFLIAARAFQGLGAAAVMSTAPAVYRTVYPSALLGRAVGISALTVAASAAAGPSIGGAILGVAPWPWLFLINVPIGTFATLFAWRALPAGTGRGGRFDLPSAFLGGPALTLFVVALDGLGRHASRVVVALELVASVALGVAFVMRQRRLAAPMLEIALFRLPRFSLAAITSLASFVAQGLAFVALPFLFQVGMGYSAFGSGMLFTPWPLTIAGVAPIAGRLSDRFPPPILSTAGLCVLTLGLVLLATLGAHASALDIVLRAAVCGLGFGLFQAPNNRELLGSAPRESSGSASGILATVRVTGQSLGAALVAIVLGSVAPSALERVAHPGIVNGAHLALWIAAACAALAALVSALRLRPGRSTSVQASPQR